jgi:hypothetical protein
MREGGGRSHCATAIRNALGRKTARLSAERGQEIQNMRLTRYKTAMDATTL